MCGWLITWAPGTKLELHDHGDAAGSLAVVSGTLTEQFRHRRRAEPLATRHLATGSLVSFDADHVHEVANTGFEPAVSIHVYAPSLEGMTFYADDHVDPSRTLPFGSPLLGDEVDGPVPVAASSGPRRSLADRWLNGFR